jgi:hypothetical protein
MEILNTPENLKGVGYSKDNARGGQWRWRF